MAWSRRGKKGGGPSGKSPIIDGLLGASGGPSYEHLHPPFPYLLQPVPWGSYSLARFGYSVLDESFRSRVGPVFF